MRVVSGSLPPLILASASPRRAELLRGLGLDFEIVPSQAKEIYHDQLTGREIAQINAYRKARQVAKKHPDCLVVGADTLVCLEDRIFGKPATLEEAYEFLVELQARTHQVVTAICLLYLRQHHQRNSADVTSVTFRPLDASAIRRYLTLVNPLDKAGAYAVQEHGELLVETISGSYTNVIGLPIERLQEELATWTKLRRAPLPDAVFNLPRANPGVGPRPEA